MTQPDLTEWDDDLTASPAEEYAALVKAIRWAKGFGLLFVECTPAEGERLMEQVQADVPDKSMGVLRLADEIADLHETVADFPGIETTAVLFVTGLEKSLVPYIQPGYGSEGDYYAKDTIPKLLGKLNLQRERFKEDFPVCFVFLVPRYAMRYLIRRAADFFDWRSGVWEFVPPPAELRQEATRIWLEGDYNKYLTWTPQQRRERVLTIEDLLTHFYLSPEEIRRLRLEQGNLLAADQRYEEAIAAYDQALALKPDKHEALYNKGIALGKLGRFEEAIAAYDQALALKPDDHEALYSKGIALGNLGRYSEALAAYDYALAINPNDDRALYNKACCYGLQGQTELALENLQQAIDLNPEENRELAKTDTDFDPIRHDARFQAWVAGSEG